MRNRLATRAAFAALAVTLPTAALSQQAGHSAHGAHASEAHGKQGGAKTGASRDTVTAPTVQRGSGPAAKGAKLKAARPDSLLEEGRRHKRAAEPAHRHHDDGASAQPGQAYMVSLAPDPTSAMEPHRPAPQSTGQTGQGSARVQRPVSHAMWMHTLPGSWHLMGMAQVFPTLTTGSVGQEKGYLRAGGVYATQPAVMANLASPGMRLVFRTTLNFEELTQENGELTYGGWGEGFIDARHPHTLLHEAMVSANLWRGEGGALSLSAGKGFAPYGTDDPMGRPGLKFPTNHHLSQVLERWTVNATVLAQGWSLEAGVFGGAEPTDAYDLSNIESFGDSWSVRLSRRLGAGADVLGPYAPWELSTSHAYIEEAHHGKTQVTRFYSASVRHAADHDFGTLYSLVEWSRSKPGVGRGYYAALGEAQLGVGAGQRHQPYVRVEYATRPEYERAGQPGTPGFFRYDHDAHAIGSTRWLINTLGYGYQSSALPVSIRPYVELQHNSVRSAHGAADPQALYGARAFWSLSAGARVYLGGGRMRMGSYGALDPMTAAMRPRAGHGSSNHHEGH